MPEPTYVPVVAADAVAEKGFATFTVKGVDIAVCRFRDEYFAISNHCSHADSTFIGGRMRGYRIMCPLHGATFDIRTGEATGAPASRPIGTFPVRLRGGMVEVDVSGAAKPAD